MKQLLLATLLLVTVKLISAKLIIDVYDDVANNDASLQSCATQLETCTAKVQECKISVERLGESWVSKLAIQERAVSDMATNIKKSKRTPELRTFANCDEALASTKESGGVFMLNMTNIRLPPFEVFCLREPNSDRPWMLLQRRVSDEVDFYRGWFDYKKGFGDINGSYWLGLERMHVITAAAPHELWVHLEDFEGQKRYAKYSHFEIGDERSDYTLKILGEYTGDAGNSMESHLGQGFSTKDADNSKNEDGNCAVYSHGGWWYQDCYQSNLNGLYMIGATSGDSIGLCIEWITWRMNYSLKAVHMAIRPIPE